MQPVVRNKLRGKLAKQYERGEYAAVVKTGAKLAQHERLPAGALTLMAASFARLGQADQAAECFREAIALAPQNVLNFTHLTELLRKQERHAEAEAVCCEGLAHHPEDLELLMLHGVVLRDAQQHLEAASAFGRVLAVKSDHVPAIHELGVVLAFMGQADHATEAFCTVLMLDPDHASALRNLGQILTLAGRLDEAVEIFRLALERNPDDHFLRLRMAYQQMHMCDWTEFGEADGLLDMPAAICDAGTPFVTLALADDPAVQLRHAGAYSAKLRKEVGPAIPPPFRAMQPGDPIRIGYLSADLHDHATMYLLAGLLRERDRAAFEVLAFSHGPDCADHAMRRFVVDNTDSFTDLRAVDDARAAAIIRDADLDILVDLKGYTQDSRIGILARRPAPLQVSYLGFPGSMGSDFIDYLVADDVVIPGDERDHYAEKIISLPGSYQPNDDQRRIAEVAPTRRALGLPEQGFVFCCFNQTYKITPVEFDVWMRLLARTEGSVLWLLASNRLVEANLRAEAARRGIDPDRLVFAGKVPQAEHLARIPVADLFLDTFRINAHTTMSDALWARLPAVTFAGRQFAARVGASVLAGAGLPELVTTSLADYEALCLALAQDPARLAAIRAKLAATRDDCPLFDTRTYTRRFEAALRQALERARSGLAPADIRVAP